MQEAEEILSIIVASILTARSRSSRSKRPAGGKTGPDGVKSAAGEELPADISTSFIVRDFGGTSLTCHDPDDEHRQEMLRERERERERQGQSQEDDE